jgi:hypothetical protein
MEYISGPSNAESNIRHFQTRCASRALKLEPSLNVEPQSSHLKGFSPVTCLNELSVMFTFPSI